MGAAAYNRGTTVIARAADDRMPAANLSADRAAVKAEAARQQERIAVLERDLARARRCIAELRRAKDARQSEARDASASGDAAIRILTRLAFPGDIRTT